MNTLSKNKLIIFFSVIFILILIGWYFLEGSVSYLNNKEVKAGDRFCFPIITPTGSQEVCLITPTPANVTLGSSGGMITATHAFPIVPNPQSQTPPVITQFRQFPIPTGPIDMAAYQETLRGLQENFEASQRALCFH